MRFELEDAKNRYRALPFDSGVFDPLAHLWHKYALDAPKVKRRAFLDIIYSGFTRRMSELPPREAKVCDKIRGVYFIIKLDCFM